MAEFLSDRQRSVLDEIQRVISVYTRVFLSQSVGLIGLFWCLFDRHPALGVLLTALVLLDQAMFLKGRFAPENRDFPLQTALNVWCLLISLVDIVLLLAILFQAAGLKVAGSDSPVSDPLDFLAFGLCVLGRLGTDLAPVDAGGRLLAAGAGLVGTALLIAAAMAALSFTVRRAAAPTDLPASDPELEV